MNTSPNERDADRYADELDQDAARADFAEQEFIDHREELASLLADGIELYACGKPLLAFDDVQERVYSDFS
jgi:intracellular sulfur oxidation DsrE/DsrF family protein